MSLEASIQNLADAINSLAKAIHYAEPLAVPLPGTRDPTVLTPEEAPKRRGRPPGSSKKAEPATSEEFTDITPQPADAVAEAKAAVAARIAAVSAEATKPAAKVAEVSKQEVQLALIEVVKKHGRDACGQLCRNHGGPNLSALDPSVYPALLSEAQEMLAKDAA